MARTSTLAAALVAAALALAGCSGDAKGNAGTLPEVDSKEGFGGIAGVVVDAAIRPLGGALIILDGARNTTADLEGRFTFADVAPGLHVLDASLAAYLPAQLAVEVAEGRTAEARLTLPADPAPQPYSLTLTFDGRIEAAASIATFATDLFTRELLGTSLCTCEFNFTAGPEVQAITYEAQWTPNLQDPTGDNLYYEIYPSNNVTLDTIKSGFEEPPIHQYFLRDEAWGAADDDGEFTVRLTGSAFWPNVQQDYQIFITLWSNGPGDPGYSVVSDGA